MVENPIEPFNPLIECKSGDIPCVESYYRAALFNGAYIMMLAGLAVGYGLSVDASDFIAFIWPQ